jgi:AbrB family looped-hinge helix DNA binding protein
MNYSSAIDKRGRITVPREIRVRLGLATGYRVEFVIEGERVVVRPVTDVFEKYRGVIGKFPGGKKAINAWVRSMRDE